MLARRPGSRFNRGRIAASVPTADPIAALNWDGWWRASFPGSPWTPTASAGLSGSNGNLTTLDFVPTAGTAVNGYTPANFNGTNQGLQAGASSTFVSVSALTVIVLFKASASTAAATDFYDDPFLAGDAGGNWGLVYTSSGVRFGIFVAATKQTLHIARATGLWTMAAGRFDGTNVYCQMNQTAATPVATGGNIASLSGNMRHGKNYTSVKLHAADVLEILARKAYVSDGDLTTVRLGFNARYGLSL